MRAWLVLLVLLLGCGTAGSAGEDVASAEDASLTPEDAALDTVLPQADTELPGVDTFLPAEDTAVPAEDTAVPAEDTAVPAEDTVGPAEDTAVQPPPDPAEMGSLGWQTFAAEVASGGKSIPLDVCLPDGDGPWPVVVFTHGFSLNAAAYESWCEHLASWGFVGVFPSLPGGPLAPVTHVDLAAHLAAVLDWVEGDPTLAGEVDVERIGLAGHSMGGKVSLLLATEDTRPKAVFGVDPVDAGAPMGSQEGYPSVTPELMDKITVPLGLLGETLDGQPIPGSFTACAPADQNFQQYYDAATSPAVEIEVHGAAHMSFLDEPDCGLACMFCAKATADTDQVRALARGLLVAFMKVTLEGDEAWNHHLVGPGAQALQDQGLISTKTKNW